MDRRLTGNRGEIKDAIYAASRSQWHSWLEAHHRDKTEAWLLLYKKGTTTSSVKYSEAVEEALCYGWIDSVMKGIDKEKYAQRFTPRRKGSSWTASNVAIAERMIQAGKMQTQGLETYRARKRETRVMTIGENTMKKKVDFKAGNNIAIKVPAHQYEQTVIFYRDIIGLPQAQGHKPEIVFGFGNKKLWIDKVSHLSQSEIWLEIECDDINEAMRYFKASKVARRDEIEELPQGLQAFWISSPCGIIHLIAESD